MAVETTTSRGESVDSRLEMVAAEFKKLAAALRKNRGREEKRLHELADCASPLFSRVRQLEADWNDAAGREREHQRREWLELDTKFSEACASLSWRKDGVWPNFFVEYGIQVEFDEMTRSACVAQVRIADCDLESVITALKNQIPSLYKDFTEGEFIEQLHKSYMSARASSDQVPIFDVYKALVIGLQKPGFWRNVDPGKFKGLSVEQLRARLCKCIERNALDTKTGLELRLYPPLDSKDGLFLFNPAERRSAFVGRIEFAEARKV